VTACPAFGPGIAEALSELSAIAAEFPPDDVPGARMYARATNRLAGPAPALAEVRNLVIPRRLGGIGLRSYRPGPGQLPVVLFIHGGWFVAGDLESHDTFCRSLAEVAHCVVIAVHYRRAPEHPCPAAPQDCLETAWWIAENAEDLGVDPGTLTLVGEGAGAALVAISARRDRDGGTPRIRAQALLCPLISERQDSESWREPTETLIETPIVNRELLQRAWSMYTPPGCEAEPIDRAPEACDDLIGLPPALVVTAELDPLRAEGERHARRLQEAGVPTQLTRYPRMVHGFYGMAGVVPAGRDAIDELAAWLTERQRSASTTLPMT
jgi:acetyl esterase